MAKWKFSKHYRAECAALARRRYRRGATQLAARQREYADWYARDRLGAAFPENAEVRIDRAAAVVTVEETRGGSREITGARWTRRPIMRAVRTEVARIPLPTWFFNKPEDYAAAWPIEEAA